MPIFNAEGIDFDAFMPVTADYGPRDIKAVAAMVTEHNIGQWALEFETDLNHPGPQNTPFFKFTAERFDDTDILLTMKPGVWIVKIWKELHVFQDGMFQKTFTVPKEQLRAVRWSIFNKSIELEKEWEEERKLERSAAEQMMEERLTQAEETGDWSHLTEGERYVLKVRLLENEEIQALIAAAKERAAKKTHVAGKLDLEGVVGPDEEQILLDAKQKILDAGQIEEELLEVRTHLPSKAKILMRQGVYDQLADEAQKMYGPVEGRQTLSGGKSMGIYETTMVPKGQSLFGDSVEKVDNEKTQFVPPISIPIGLETMDGWKRPIYPEGDEPTGGNTRDVGN